MDTDKNFVTLPIRGKILLGAVATLLGTVFGYLATDQQSPIFIGLACLTLVALLMVANIRNNPPASRTGDFVSIYALVKVTGLIACFVTAASLGLVLATASDPMKIVIGFFAIALAIVTGFLTTLEGKEA